MQVLGLVALWSILPSFGFAIYHRWLTTSGCLPGPVEVFSLGVTTGRCWVGCGQWIGNILWIIEKATECPKNVYLCFINYAKAFDCVNDDKLWKVLRETGIPDHLTCLWRNLYAGQEATVRTLHGTTDCLKIEKGVGPGCLLSPCLFNLYTEHIMRILGFDEL